MATPPRSPAGASRTTGSRIRTDELLTADKYYGVDEQYFTTMIDYGFSKRLEETTDKWGLENAFRDARVDIFASTHTCLPAFRRFVVEEREVAVANNGAAGMPNFAATRFGLLTRIAASPFRGDGVAMRESVAGVHIEALRIEYDHERWLARFLASWPEDSAAHASYFGRLVRGPAYALQESGTGCGVAA